MNGPTQSRLSVLLVTDIVGSTDLKGRIGLGEYARLLAMHDETFRQLIGEFPAAEILKDTGDGYFASFATTSDAVRFSLRFQHALHRLPWGQQPLKVRIGIHVGEVAQLEKESTGKPKLVGLAADLVARIAHLAAGGQVLLTRFAFNEARQFVSAAPVPISGIGSDEPTPTLRWMAHGPYRLRGVDEVVEIFEVGIEGIAPLTTPAGNADARRAVAQDDEETLGWRPAAGLNIPARPNYWILDRRLGEGAFGEVWLARHTKLGTRRVFKFCFDADRLRSFKRELTLFRLLRDTLGDRPDIARIYEVKLDEPPYFLESEYTEGGNLHDWADAQGGVEKVPLEKRLDILARIADAVAAAHSVGILHKDIKPANILISTKDGEPRPQLADFGIGIISDRTRFNDRAITMTGFTQMTRDASSQSGTRIYLPPEMLRNQPFTTKGDVYALGVLLYQLAIGDLTHPLAEGWERGVDDPLLREDIAECVQGDPGRRLESAAELASRLRSLPQRREAMRKSAQAQRSHQRRRRLARAALAMMLILAVIVAMLAYSFYNERALRRSAETARADAEREKLEAQRQRNQAESARAAEAEQRAVADAVQKFLKQMITSVDPELTQGREVTMLEVLDAASRRVNENPSARPLVDAAIHSAIFEAFITINQPQRAVPHARAATELTAKALGQDDPQTLERVADLGQALAHADKLAEAEAELRRARDGLAQRVGPDDDRTLAQADNLAIVLLQMNRNDEAEPIIRELVDARTRKLGPDSEKALAALATLAGLTYQRERYDEAAELARKVYEGRLRTLGGGNPQTLLAGQNLAAMLNKLNRDAEAEAIARQLIEAQRASVGEDNPRTQKAKLLLAQVLQGLDRDLEAVPLLRDVYATRQRTQGAEHLETLTTGRALGMLLIRTGQADEAAGILRDVMEKRKKALGPDDVETLSAGEALAAALLAQGKAEEAIGLADELIAALERARGPDSAALCRHLNTSAKILQKLNRWEEAEQRLLRSVKLAHSARSQRDAFIRTTAREAAEFYAAWNKPEKAAEFAALAARHTPPPASRPGASPAAATAPVVIAPAPGQ